MNKVSYNKVRLSLAVLLCLCTISMVDAKVKLPALISDRMVLQREQSIKVWGMADAGKNTVTTRLISNSGYPHFVQEKPYKIICGNEEASLLGEWKYRLGAASRSGNDVLLPVQCHDCRLAPHIQQSGTTFPYR